MRNALLYLFCCALVAISAQTEEQDLIGAPELIQDIGKLTADLSDKNWIVRGKAARSLGLLRQKAAPALDALKRLLKDDVIQVRESAAAALIEIIDDPKALTELAVPLLNDHWAMAQCAAEALGLLGPKAAGVRAQLQKFHDEHEEWYLREIAAWALNRVDNKMAFTFDTRWEQVSKDLNNVAQLEADRERNIIYVRCKNVSDEEFTRAKLHHKEFCEHMSAELFGGLQRANPITIVLHKGDTAGHVVAEKLGLSIKGLLGRYDSRKKVLCVNLEIGDGNLTHETMHMLVDMDYAPGPASVPGGYMATWLNEGLGGFGEGSISVRGEIECSDFRHDVLLRALKKKQSVSLEASWLDQNLPPDLPPLTIGWLISLSDEDFDKHYYRPGSLSMALARELMHYLNSESKLPAFYRGFKTNLLKYRGSRYRKWLSPILAKSALESAFGKSLKEIENDFLKWIMKRGAVPWKIKTDR